MVTSSKGLVCAKDYTVAVMGMLRKELVAFLFLALVASSWQEETSPGASLGSQLFFRPS